MRDFVQRKTWGNLELVNIRLQYELKITGHKDSQLKIWYA